MTAYPKTMELLDGQQVTIRPMVSADKDALLEFFLRVSEEDRYYLKEDVTSPDVIKQWSESLNDSRALPMLALAGEKIVADGTLHRRRAGARKHIGAFTSFDERYASTASRPQLRRASWPSWPVAPS